MTLSAIGDADTPAGGSVCIRYEMFSRLELLRFLRSRGTEEVELCPP